MEAGLTLREVEDVVFSNTRTLEFFNSADYKQVTAKLTRRAEERRIMTGVTIERLSDRTFRRRGQPFALAHRMPPFFQKSSWHRWTRSSLFFPPRCMPKH